MGNRNYADLGSELFEEIVRERGQWAHDPRGFPDDRRYALVNGAEYLSRGMCRLAALVLRGRLPMSHEDISQARSLRLYDLDVPLHDAGQRWWRLPA